MKQLLELNQFPGVFVVSSGRAGTTLLISILNASKQISFPYESDFIARAYPYYQNKKKFHKIDYQRIVKLFKQTSQPQGWGMSTEYLIEYLLKRNPQNFAEIDSIICEAYHQLQKTDFVARIVNNLRYLFRDLINYLKSIFLTEIVCTQEQKT